MFVILEGVDGSGKSSLAQAVSDEIRRREPRSQVFRTHHSQLKKHPLDEYHFPYASYSPNGKSHVVADRLHWGELVYGPLYRDKSALSLGQFRWIELWLKSRGAVGWNITNDLNVILERLDVRGEDYLKTEHVGRVLKDFVQIAGQSAIAFGHARVQGYIRPLVDEIVNTADYTAASVESVADDFPSFIGSTLPQVLLLGEKRGGSEPHETTRAFMPRTSNSGEYLLASLPDPLWRNVAIANAVEEADRLPDLVDALYGPNVVALGREAAAACDRTGVEHSTVPHPAYIKRFKNDQQERYGRLVEEAASTQSQEFPWPN